MCVGLSQRGESTHMQVWGCEWPRELSPVHSNDLQRSRNSLPPGNLVSPPYRTAAYRTRGALVVGRGLSKQDQAWKVLGRQPVRCAINQKENNALGEP